MTGVLQVAPWDYYRSAQLLSEVESHSRKALTGCADMLSAAGGMGGSDNAGQEWGREYDEGARVALEVATSLVNSAANTSSLLHTCGEDYAFAESESTVGGGDNDYPGMAPVPTPLAEPSTPSAVGDKFSFGGPLGWVWDQLSGLVGYLWPNGDEDMLRRAGDQWQQTSSELASVSGSIRRAKELMAAQQAPDAPLALDRLTQTHACHDRLCEGFTQIGQACHDYAHHVEEAHRQLLHELEEFAKETVVLEVASGVLAFFTAGISEVAGHVVLAERAAVVAGKIRRIIKALIAAAKVAKSAITKAIRIIFGPLIKMGRRLKVMLTKPSALRMQREADAAAYELYKTRKIGEGLPYRSQEDYLKVRNQLAKNKANDAAQELEVEKKYGYDADHGYERQVWVPGGPGPGQAGSRRWDIANPETRHAIEVKSGQVSTKDFERQLAIDIRMVEKNRWTMTWNLKEPLTRAQMATLHELERTHPGKFIVEGLT